MAIDSAGRGGWRITAVLVSAFAMTACDGSDNNRSESEKPQATNPTVEGPITGGGGGNCCRLAIGNIEIDLTELLNYTPGTPFYAGLYFDKSELGYRETEYFISGTATSYIATDELGEDGVWSIETADAEPFKTRIVVLRPEDAADFNGTVVVEWFNVSGGTDASPELVQTHTELMRRGYAWVGVSAQSVGVEGGGSAYDVSLKIIDPDRYGSLSHPGDSFSYDMFSQAAQAVRHPMGIDPLDGLKVQYMIGVGESQSARRMTTYINAIHPTVELFDGFLIHSHGGAGSPLSQEPQVVVPTPTPTFIRNDFSEPVIDVESETDISVFGAPAAPQPDADNFRLWEVAGSAHYDAYGVVKGPVDRGDDPGVAAVIETRSGDSVGIIECDLPINDGAGHWVLNAGIAALNHWVRTGEAAASAEPLVRNMDGTALQRDQLGNAVGGVRTPWVDAPIATLSGFGNSGTQFCFLFGSTALFDEATLSNLYPSQAAYIDAIDTASAAAVHAGFLLPADADLIKTQARASGIGGP